jgi:hypothetical protein
MSDDLGPYEPHLPCRCERCARLHGDQAYEEDRAEDHGGILLSMKERKALLRHLGSPDTFDRAELAALKRRLEMT